MHVDFKTLVKQLKKMRQRLTPMDHLQQEEHHFHNPHTRVSILSLWGHQVALQVQTCMQLQISAHRIL